MSLILYILLGVLLSLAGVGVMDKPVYFLLIMATVAGIDILSRHG